MLVVQITGLLLQSSCSSCRRSSRDHTNRLVASTGTSEAVLLLLLLLLLLLPLPLLLLLQLQRLLLLL